MALTEKKMIKRKISGFSGDRMQHLCAISIEKKEGKKGEGRKHRHDNGERERETQWNVIKVF